MSFWRDFFEGATTIGLMIGGLAALALIVSNRSNTVGVLQAGASGFNNAVATAISPVTGANATPVLAYPTGGGFTGNFGPLNM